MMEGPCSCDVDYGFRPELYSERNVQARKKHKCCECNETICKGDVYERIIGKWDGDFGSFATCATCAKIRSVQAPCSLIGSLRETLWECLGVDYVTGEFADWTDEAVDRKRGRDAPGW